MSFPCPCCGCLTLSEPPPGTFEICPVCGWEDDNVQFDDPDFSGGANEMSLREASESYLRCGAIAPAVRDLVRLPRPDELPEWMLNLPLIINNHGDVQIFETVSDAESYMEAVDIRNQEYVGYDAAGRLLLIATDGRIGVVRPAEARPSHQEEVRKLLVRLILAARTPMPDASSASLSELVELTRRFRYRPWGRR